MTLDQFLKTALDGMPAGSWMVFAVALAGGVVASAVCPCTLPVGLGVASVAGSREQQAKHSGFAIAVAFFLGIVLNLALLGAIAGRLGAIMTLSFGRYWALAMSIMSLLAAAIAVLGPRLTTERLSSLRSPTLLGTVVYGFLFSFGTSAAPLLLLLALAAAAANPIEGLAIALAFGIGRGLPFLIIAASAGAIIRLTNFGARGGLYLRYVSAALLVFVSAYYAHTFLVLS